VLFETRCRNLRADLRCAVYDERPHICRGFDNTECDVNAPGARALTLREPAEFLRWLEAKRPRLHAKLEGRFTPERWQPGTKAKTARARRAVARKARS
jgi:Fe-S-cluster containining protein